MADTAETKAAPVPARPVTFNRSGRAARVPIHGYRSILGVKGLEEGWHYAWINDEFVDRFLNAWYEFVTHDVEIGDRKLDAASQIGSKYSKAVGNGVTAYLMRCPQEVYNEEMGRLESETDASEGALKARLNSKADGQYGGVEIFQTKPLANK